MPYPVFVDKFPEDELFKVCQISHAPKILVRLHPSPLTHRRVWVHWVKELKRSLACIGDECGNCKSIGKEPRCYTPALEWHNKQQKWVKRIFPVNASCLHVLDRDLLNESYLAYRRYNAKNAPVTMEVASLHVQPLPVPDFDITKTLLRMWGVQTRVD